MVMKFEPDFQGQSQRRLDYDLHRLQGKVLRHLIRRDLP